MFKSRKNFILKLFLSLVFALVPVSSAQAATGITFTGYSALSEYSNPISIGDITNIAGKPSITVTDLPVGAIVKVYDQSSDGKLLGSATVKNGQTSAIISLSSLNSNVYVSVTLESIRATITVEASDDLTSDSITVINNASTADTVTVTDLEVGDIVKVYSDLVGTKLLGTATIASGKTEAVVSIAQLPTFASLTGKVYVSLTSIGKTESGKIEKDYDAEPQSFKLEAHNIAIINNAGLADTVTVMDNEDISVLEIGDIVKVYNEEGNKLLGSAKAVKGKTVPVVAVVSIRQLGTAEGWVKVSVTSKGSSESDKLDAEYDEEKLSAEPAKDDITVIDNPNTNDKVTVTGLKAGDIVKVYNANVAGKLLGKATAKGSTEAEAVVVIRKLSTDNEVWVTVTSSGMQESERIQKGYTAFLVPTEVVSDITFSDTDKDPNQIGGVVSWTAPDDVDNVTHYEIYTSKNGTTKGVKLGEVAVGTEIFTIPNNKKSTGVTHIAIYTKNLVGEAITGVYVPIIDTTN